MTIWHLTGAAITAALLLAWAWWRRGNDRFDRELESQVRDALAEQRRQHQLAFTSMDPKYVGRDLIVQVDGPQSQQLHVDAYLRHVAAIDAENQRLIEQFNREYAARLEHDRSLAEQRRLDEMEL